MKINFKMLLMTDAVAVSLILLVAVIAIVLIFLIKALIYSKKKENAFKNLKPDSYVVTVSGICGKIVGVKSTKEITYVLLLTGDSTHKNYITVDGDSIYKMCENPGEILKDEIKTDHVETNNI